MRVLVVDDEAKIAGFLGRARPSCEAAALAEQEAAPDHHGSPSDDLPSPADPR